MKKTILAALAVVMIAAVTVGCDSSGDEEFIANGAADAGVATTVTESQTEQVAPPLPEAAVEPAPTEEDVAADVIIPGTPATPDPLVIVTDSFDPVFAGLPFAIRLEATGGSGNYLWSIEDIKCPSIKQCFGHTGGTRIFYIKAGEGGINGKIPYVGTYEVVIKVTDKETKESVTGEPIELNVTPAMSPKKSLKIEPIITP